MSRGGTGSYAVLHDDPSVPALVHDAVRDAESLDFDLCVRPEIGRLLAVLAGGLPAGSRVGESGTGTGAGLGWMVSAARPDVDFVSFELDAARAASAQARFADHDHVEIVAGDGADLFARGPFDLLVLDGGPGSGKLPGDTAIDPSAVLRPGGTLTVDDYTPTITWPPSFLGDTDAGRIRWFDHPLVRTTEVRVAADLAVLVVRYFPPAAPASHAGSR